MKWEWRLVKFRYRQHPRKYIFTAISTIVALYIGYMGSIFAAVASVRNGLIALLPICKILIRKLIPILLQLSKKTWHFLSGLQTYLIPLNLMH